jgi:hypothetical protein
MKTIGFLFAAAVAYATPEFVGVLTIGQDSMFAVMDLDLPPRWLRIGQEFRGHQIVEYRTREDILVLKKNGTTLELRLRDAKVRTQNHEISATDAYARAIREVQKRETWGANARYDNPQRGPKNWLIPVFHRLADGREECVLVGVGLATGDIVEYSHFAPHPGGMKKRPNKAPEPTPGSVMPRATESTSK